jgi:hypothetical protein
MACPLTYFIDRKASTGLQRAESSAQIVKGAFNEILWSALCDLRQLGELLGNGFVGSDCDVHAMFYDGKRQS